MTTPEQRIRKKISQILKELEEPDENLNWWNLAHLARDASAVAIATANNHVMKHCGYNGRPVPAYVVNKKNET